jgi:hypothetical protein
MCVAILKTKSNRVTRKELTDAWNTNPDGAGIAWSEKGKLHVVKSYESDGSMMDQKKFINKVVKLQTKYLAKNMLIHFRIATQGFGADGMPDVDNCHPFAVNDDVVFIHNGMINMPVSNRISDTRFFNRLYLQKLPFKFSIGNEALRKLIESKIGSSKLVFLDSKGKYDIANEGFGSWEKGNWFSNRNHCRIVRRFSFDNALLPSDDEFRLR